MPGGGGLVRKGQRGSKIVCTIAWQCFCSPCILAGWPTSVCVFNDQQSSEVSWLCCIHFFCMSSFKILMQRNTTFIQIPLAVKQDMHPIL
jgi:hypothetical protein